MDDMYEFVCSGCGNFRLVARPRGEESQAWKDGIEMMREKDLKLLCNQCYDRRFPPRKPQVTTAAA